MNIGTITFDEVVQLALTKKFVYCEQLKGFVNISVDMDENEISVFKDVRPYIHHPDDTIIFERVHNHSVGVYSALDKQYFQLYAGDETDGAHYNLVIFEPSNIL